MAAIGKGTGFLEVSIIIVSYNTLKLTKNCLESIFFQTSGVSFEVILVDNASTDGSKEFFSADKRIKYIYSEENLGFGRANNLGYKQAKGKYIFLLNSDTVLLNNAIEEFYNYMESAPDEIGCVGCMLTDVSGNKMHSFGNFPDVSYFWKKVLSYDLGHFYKTSNNNYIPNKYPEYVDYITGADLFIRRSVIEKYGLFDPVFFLYFEETEMQHRYAYCGVKRVIIDTPRIMHLEGKSSTSSMWNHTLKSKMNESRSIYLYIHKVLPKSKVFLVRCMQLLLIPRIWTLTVPKEEKREFTKMILSNLFYI